MSDLVYQNYNNRCQGWSAPSSLTGPQINSLSGYQSPAGSSTVVSISGVNFFSYSVIRFGTFTPTTYFINSNIIQFYIPNTLSSGTFPVQVFNGSIPSNIVTYTIDNASGYWLLNGQNITNSNTNSSGGVGMSWLSRGIPTPITSSDYGTGTSYTVPNNVNWIICNNGSNPLNITLPNGTQYTGREIMFKNIGTGQVLSTTSNISSLDGSTTSNVIVDNMTGHWTTLVSTGSTWIIMQANW
jgi:hypothetical protein